MLCRVVADNGIVLPARASGYTNVHANISLRKPVKTITHVHTTPLVRSVHIAPVDPRTAADVKIMPIETIGVDKNDKPHGGPYNC